MSEIVRTYIEAEVTDNCALEFIDDQATKLIPYVCGQCAVLAAMDPEGIIKIATGY